jgi:hypothetical protein
MRVKEPHLVNNMFEAIQSIADEGRRALGDPELSREQLLSAITVWSFVLPAVAIC